MIIQLKVNEQVYLKDPESTDLGKRIIQESISLISQIGFEAFTFKKLAANISSTEASVYRYFENKHKLLIYLVSWYWNWMEYKLIFSVTNIPSAEERLRIAIRTLSQQVHFDENWMHIDEVALYNIVIAESAKAYLTKAVDVNNKEGFFASYKRLCLKVADIISEVNPDYEYPIALTSTLIETVHEQKYFAKHIPSITELSTCGEDNLTESLTDYLTNMVFSTIAKK